jgi:DNA-binding response OmpR family regulator
MVDLGDKAVHGNQPGDPDLRLTPIEWQLVEILVRHPGKLITQHQLLEQIWGPSSPPTPTTFASTWRSCATSSNRTRPTLDTC